MTKGQIPVIEVITVTIILFVSFSIFFPQTGFQNRWEDAEIIKKGRDMILTMDRTGLINNYVASPTALAGFINKVLPEKNLLSWSTLDGTVQSTVTVACNCTTQQIDNLSNWIGRMKINGRDIQIDFIASTLSPIQQSDVLLIFGETGLGSYKNDILSYIDTGRGVVGLSDVNNPDGDYTQIFGIRDCNDVLGPSNCGGNGDSTNDFAIPSSVSQLTYGPYKLFTHVPIRSLGSLGVAPIPLENASVPPCPIFPVFQGTFSFKSVDSTWWVCNSTHIYFDTNQNNLADKALKENETFSINGFGFKESYIEVNRTFVSIKSGFVFDDVRKNSVKVYPVDGDANKILLRDGSYNGGNPIPVIVANGSSSGRVFWSADFLTDTPVNHDERLLIASLLLAASSKKNNQPTVGSLQVGFLTPYINIVNRDMFEVYQFNLGLGFPF